MHASAAGPAHGALGSDALRPRNQADVNTKLHKIPPLIRPEHDPTTLRTAPWGGRRLASMRAGPLEGPAIGESMEFSTLPGSQSRALGCELSELLRQPLPFVAKLLDTAAPLSIQVHPQDDFTVGRIGKEEAWVILDAEEDAYVRAGVVDGVSEEMLQDAMDHVIEYPDHVQVLTDALRRIPVSRGMVILVPAGTVHSIGPGILLAEMQQPIDSTFRLFDYGSTRPIHPEAARAAWLIDASPLVWHPGDATRPIDGRHLSLCVRERGDTTIPADGVARLLVAVGDGIRVSVDSEDEITMMHGDLLLHTHSELRVHVGDGATLVMGTVNSRPT